MFTSIGVKIRQGEGRFWSSLKWAARGVLQFHIPVLPTTKPVFRILYTLHVMGRESWRWVLRFFWFEPLFRSQCESVGERFQMEFLPYMSGHGSIRIGARVRLSGKSNFIFCNRVYERPELVFGDDSFLGHNCAIRVAQKVTIGKNCLIAAGVKMQDYDGHPIDAGQRREGQPPPSDGVKPIIIGNDVWIGNGALILKGITIGDRAIVGAESVVTKNVPSDVVVAGNPARVVKHLILQTSNPVEFTAND